MLVFFDVILRVLSKEEGMDAILYIVYLSTPLLIKERIECTQFFLHFFHSGCGYLFHFYHSMRMEKNN